MDGPKALIQTKKSEVPWLEEGLKMLAQVGVYAFNIDDLARSVGTAKSSFYFLFESKDEFFIRLANYWAWKGTFSYKEQMLTIADPEDQFAALVRLIYRDRFEGLAWIQFHNLTGKIPAIAEILEVVENARTEIVGGIFEGLGLSKSDAQKKAYAFMHIYFGWLVLHWGEPKSPNQASTEINDLLTVLGLPKVKI